MTLMLIGWIASEEERGGEDTGVGSRIALESMRLVPYFDQCQVPVSVSIVKRQACMGTDLDGE